MAKVTETARKLIDLPFGLFLGRRASPKSKGYPDLPSPIPMPQRASNAPESPLEHSVKEAVASLGTVKRGSRSTNALMSGAPDKREVPVLPRPENLGGRKTVENTSQISEFDIWTSYAKRKTNLLQGLTPDFDLNSVASVNIDELSDILADISPEVSKAVWDFIILSNSGYTTKAFFPNTEEIDQQAQNKLNEKLDILERNQGSVGVFFDRLFKLIFLRGSFLMELVLADNARDFIDVATPDTSTLEFKRVNDPLRGQTWTFGQRIKNEFVNLNIPTIRYIPIHPAGDSIEGHAVCSSAFFLAIFLMSVLRDTKRVVEHQGYLRLDVEVKFKELAGLIPEDILNDADQLTEWQRRVLAAVEEVYSSLEPDDTYVHGDAIAVNNPVGAVSSDSLAAIDALFQALERMAVRALKTMPLLLGTNQSRSETQANREWEIYAKGIETIQHYVETAFEYIMEMAMRADGIQCTVQHRFARFRAAEAMRDEQVATVRAKLARYLYDCGYINQDEAAQRALDKEVKADVPEPRNLIPAGASTQPFENENPNEGEGRTGKRPLTRGLFETVDEFDRWMGIYFNPEREPTLEELNEAEKFLDDYAPEEAQDMFDADVATAEEQEEVETV